jgi:hypothetical protein
MTKKIKPSPFATKKVRRYIKNAFNTFSSVAPLKQVLFSKINRHEHQPVPPVKPSKNDDFADARHYERFTTHSSHLSSKNFI